MFFENTVLKIISKDTPILLRMVFKKCPTFKFVK